MARAHAHTLKLAAAAALAAGLLALSVSSMGASVQRTLCSESTASAARLAVAASTVQGETTVWDDGSVTRGVSLENAGAACWCRVRTVYSADGLSDVATAGGYSLPEGWVLAADGWAYRTSVLGEGEEASFSEEVSDVFADGKNKEMEAAFEVQSLQDFGVEPDFSSAAPWAPYVGEASS